MNKASLVLLKDGALVPLSGVGGHPEPFEDSVRSLLSPIVFRDSPGGPKRVLDFFGTQLPNENTRLAYVRATSGFFGWCEARYLSLQSIEPLHVAEYLGNLSLSTPSVKLQVAAIRRLFGYLVNYGEMSINPAANVKTARQSISTGKTQVMEAADVRVLFESMGDGKLVTLRDRALIGTMVYTFARVSAVVKMRVEDYLTVGKRSLLRLHEKGGKEHQVPVHLVLEGYLDGYLAKAELGKKDWLFPSAVASSDRLSGKQMARENVMHMVKRRTERAGLGGLSTWSKSRINMDFRTEVNNARRILQRVSISD